MRTLQNLSVAVLLLMVCNFTCADEKSQQEKQLRAKLNQWAGEWTVSAEVNHILGYAEVGKRNAASFDHPTSFRLTFHEELGKSLEKLSLDALRDQVFTRIGHELVATGKWEAKFEDDPGVGNHCFVTRHAGSIFMWCAAPYIAIYGGRVSFLQGAKRDRDVFVIDFNSYNDRLAGSDGTEDTVAYKRVTNAKSGATASAGDQTPPRIDAPPSDVRLALFGKLPKPGKEWKQTDDGQTKGGMHSWVHFKHAESGDVLAFAATRNSAPLKVGHSPIRQASIEPFTHTGVARISTRLPSEPIADAVRNRIVTISAGNGTNDRKYREEAIEFSYVYEPSGESPPNMAHGYAIVLGDWTVFVQHTSHRTITSQVAADMVCGLLTKHLAEQTSIPKGWGAMIRRNEP